ncbi:MAG: Ig-like domain-containing protein [Acidimicrobiales bacterium]
MGTSAGWRDVYGAYLTYQWVDVSETAPGIYYLANEADPYNRIVEANESNNQVQFARTSSVVPGYNALPVGPVSTLGVPLAVTLQSQQFGTPGSRQFRVVTPPAHGTLNVATGANFTAASVTYTPNPGYTGPDSFEYVARDASSSFPLNPTRAAVSIDVGAVPTPSVDISGAPASLIAGTSAALPATVANSGSGVTWSVNGVVGGNATVGTVSPSGLYVAPSAVPAGGSVVVRAALTTNPSVFDEVTIGIDPVPNTAPIVTAPAHQYSTVGDSISINVPANDPDGDPFTFSAAGLPPGLAINPNTGVISGVATTAGTFNPSVTVDDGRDPTTVDFAWTVDVRPVVRPGGAGIYEGDSGTQTVRVPVLLSAPVSQPVTVNWTTLATNSVGLATVGQDFIGGSGVVTFAPGQTTAYVDVVIKGDTIAEPPAWVGEWGLISFSSVSANASLDVSFYGLGIFVIIDDD